MSPSYILALAFLNAALFTVAQPTITFEPKDQTAVPGQRITLTISATGIAPVTFQWQREGLPLVGMTATSLVFTNIQAPDVGDYSAVVTDSSGSVTGRVATHLRILPRPIALPPRSLGWGRRTKLTLRSTTMAGALGRTQNQSALSDIQFRWETSVNLIDWVPVEKDHEGVSDETEDPSKLRVIVLLHTVTDSKRFLRLAVSRTPPMR